MIFDTLRKTWSFRRCCSVSVRFSTRDERISVDSGDNGPVPACSWAHDNLQLKLFTPVGDTGFRVVDHPTNIVW